MTYIKSKETSQTRVDKSDLQVYPGKLTDLARYQTKSRDKLVNHSCQLARYGTLQKKLCKQSRTSCERSRAFRESS